ncbi:MAG: tetratricopeptide repeat protein, partial [Desulfobacteraceae bacterium]|nr:tetratricopeptide repeat protein [Desulfobacteraceae bacterium]
AVSGLLCGCGSSNDTMSDLEKGNLAFARRDFFTAADILKKAHAKNPDNLALITRLGECYVKLGRPERALIFFEKAGAKAPDDVEIQIRLAQLYLLTWQFHQAKKICGMLEQKQTTHPGYYLLKADISVLDGYPELAESYYRDAVIQSKDSLRALMKLAIFLKSMDREKEAAEILAIVGKNPTPAPGILLLLADYHLLDNDFDTAQTYLQEAVANEPEDLGLRYHLVQFYLAAGKHAKAQTLLETLVEKQDDLFLWMALADVYIMTGQMDEARDLIDRLKQAVPDKVAQFELLQGKYWLYAKKPVFAASHLKTALDLQPGLVNTRYLFGLTHLLNGKIKLAENKLVQTLQLEPDHHDALMRMGQLLYKKKEYGLAINYLDTFIAAYPEDASGYLLKGLNLLGLADYAGAMEQFALALALTVTADTHVPLYYLGLASELSQHYSRALGYYKAAFDARPGLVDVCYRYHLMLMKTGQTGLVQDHTGAVLAGDDHTPLQYYTAASLAGQMDQVRQQIALLEKAIATDPGFGAGYIALAKALRKDNQFNRSIKILKTCTQKNPDYEDAWMALARCSIAGQDPEAALEILEQAHEKLQGSPVFLGNLAWLLLENNKDVNKALNLAQMAYERLPDNIAIADTLGWAYYHKGIYSQAAWLFADILQKAPDNAMVHFHLGMTCYRQGDIDKAVHHLQTAKTAGLAQNHM